MKGRINVKKIIALTAAGVLLVSGCAAQGPIAAKVGNEQVTKAQVQFYKDNYTGMLDSNLDPTEGAIQYAIDDKILLELSDKVDEYKLTDEDAEQVKTILYSFRKSRGGTAKYEKYLKDMGLTDEFVNDAMTAFALKNKLSESLNEEVANDETKKQYFKDNYLRAKHILLSTKDMETGEAYDDAKKAEVKAKAEELLARAQSGEDFDALVAEYSEDPGSKSNPDGYTFGEGQMVPEFENAVKEAEIGEITLCESDYGYHIIKRLALDETQEIFDAGYKQAEGAIESELTHSLFSEKLREKAAENGIEIQENESGKNKITKKLATATPYPTPESTQQPQQ